MIYRIKSDRLIAEINSKGAELWSVKAQEDDRQYIWQGDKNYWGRRSPNLFPFCGRQTDGIYRYRGKEYSMPMHGFARDMEFHMVLQTDSRIIFSIEDNEELLKLYPFSFRLSIAYELDKDMLTVTYIVENPDDKTMYFAIGGHTGYNVPIDKKLTFEDYEIRLDTSGAKKILLDSGFVTGESVPCTEVSNGRLQLRHELFDEDAIVLEEMGNSMRIQSRRSDAAIRIQFSDMRYAAVWHIAGKAAPFVCIEPWTSLPARLNVIEDLEQKEDLIRLDPGLTYHNRISMQFIRPYGSGKAGRLRMDLY